MQEQNNFQLRLWSFLVWYHGHLIRTAAALRNSEKLQSEAGTKRSCLNVSSLRDVCLDFGVTVNLEMTAISSLMLPKCLSLGADDVWRYKNCCSNDYNTCFCVIPRLKACVWLGPMETQYVSCRALRSQQRAFQSHLKVSVLWSNFFWPCMFAFWGLFVVFMQQQPYILATNAQKGLCSNTGFSSAGLQQQLVWLSNAIAHPLPHPSDDNSPMSAWPSALSVSAICNPLS